MVTLHSHNLPSQSVLYDWFKIYSMSLPTLFTSCNRDPTIEKLEKKIRKLAICVSLGKLLLKSHTTDLQICLRTHLTLHMLWVTEIVRAFDIFS